MKQYDSILKNDERAILVLRDLYKKYGYSFFKTGKFEEYELYARNKDFLGSDGILTFTDTNGKLMALKPDVTLSIAKNSEHTPGTVQKFYYDDFVYRLSKGTHVFKEITQTGIECIGDLGVYDICEVISLAVKSLELIDSEYILDISHMGIVKGLAHLLNLPEDEEDKVIICIGNKNYHGVSTICDRNDVEPSLTEKVGELIKTYGPMEKVLSEIDKLVVNDEMQKAVDELIRINNILKAAGLDKNVRFDFSVINDMGYYNGVIFQGFINGISERVLSGGRYDNLMAKMNKKCGAIGLTVSLDMLDRLKDEKKKYDVDVLLIATEAEDSIKVGEAVRKLIEKGETVSVQKTIPEKMRYERLLEMKNGEVYTK